MSPEEIQGAPGDAPAAPAPVPETAPAPPSAPEPVSAPSATAEAPPDERATPPSDIWNAMFDRMAGPPPPSIPEQIEKVEGRPPRAPRPAAPAPTPAPPAGTRTWADKYETPEALESAYREAQVALQRAENERQGARAQAERLERLLYATMQQRGGPPGEAPAAPQAPPTPQELQAALDLVRQEHERLALSDPNANPLALVRAMAVASRLDEEARAHYADTALREVWQRAHAQQQIQSVQDKFFELYPDLRQAEPSLLRQVAINTENALRRTRGDYGSAAYMQQWFNDTATVARRTIRLGDSQGATPPASGAPPSSPPPARSTHAGAGTSRQARGAPFAETPSPRASEPQLTGQDAHLARIFGSGR